MLVADERISPFFTEINKESLSWKLLDLFSYPYPSSSPPAYLSSAIYLSPISAYPPISTFNMSALAAARYGKDNVRVYKVHRDEKSGIQTVVEMTVCVLLEGDIETS